MKKTTGNWVTPETGVVIQIKFAPANALTLYVPLYLGII